MLAVRRLAPRTKMATGGLPSLHLAANLSLRERPVLTFIPFKLIIVQEFICNLHVVMLEATT